MCHQYLHSFSPFRDELDVDRSMSLVVTWLWNFVFSLELLNGEIIHLHYCNWADTICTELLSLREVIKEIS